MSKLLFRLVLAFVCLIAPFQHGRLLGQGGSLKLAEIKPSSLEFEWPEGAGQSWHLHYGLRQDLELGRIEAAQLQDLLPATSYFVQACQQADCNGPKSEIGMFSSASATAGKIRIYFNHPVNNNASGIADAIYNPHFEDSIVEFVNQAQASLDIANYNTGSLPIVTAINNAAARGVIIRYIAADNTGSNNDELQNLSSSIPMIQRPADGEVMHNKFIIRDDSLPANAAVLTGSTNHTAMSCGTDYNNMVIIQDQAIARTYQVEFEEMWGSTGNQPNLANAKFGAQKTDNTSHVFIVGGILLEIYFSPSDQTTSKIEAAINSANFDMQFGMLTFIHNDLGDAVLAAHNRGVDTKGIIENIYYIGSEYNSLLNGGVDVLSHFSLPGFMHHKYGIIDANFTSSDPMVITGSHNWTNSAETDYDENTLIIHDATIAGMYYEEFMQRYVETGGAVGQADANLESLGLELAIQGDHLLLRSKQALGEWQLMSLEGRTLLAGNAVREFEIALDLAGLAAGIYLLQVKGKSGWQCLKVQKMN